MSQVRLEWIIVKVQDEPQHFHTPDSWEERGRQSLGLGEVRSGLARWKGMQRLGIQMLSVQPDTKPKGCAGCNRKIKDRYLLKALDKYWHEDCLKCACCDCRLGEVGSTLYTKANLILCRRDYLRLFGVTGNCAACSKLIPAFEMVMRAKDNVYHLDCFACQLCNQRFCVGDKFFLKNNMILCQTDYEEGLMKEGYAPQVR
ncbi:LIM domain only protein 3 isoform X1 [Mustela lutreola]|uniref:LIM domain only protein 3 n=1 Tax=Mustela putorius furo TaxID=9669 RepID=A0A8U0SX29_MUSPF|nr:LIM domain only protein 3 isoform X1 [Mustela putorius furo]XP_059041927.1 LIM domain only protein 3 isoform X1 [Mustela lutreola]